VTEFILTGLTEKPELELPLYLLFLGVYMVTVVGNLGMIILIGFSSHLHTSMYFFISSLSFIDLCQSTDITPKMLVNFVTEKNIISYLDCLSQFFCLPCSYYCRVSHVSYNGIWSLRCHLYPLILQCHHVLSSLYLYGTWGVWHRLDWCYSSHGTLTKSEFFAGWCNKLFLLWSISSIGATLL
jgi:hypothetical protein